MRHVTRVLKEHGCLWKVKWTDFIAQIWGHPKQRDCPKTILAIRNFSGCQNIHYSTPTAIKKETFLIVHVKHLEK